MFEAMLFYFCDTKIYYITNAVEFLLYKYNEFLSILKYLLPIEQHNFISNNSFYIFLFCFYHSYNM